MSLPYFLYRHLGDIFTVIVILIVLILRIWPPWLGAYDGNYIDKEGNPARGKNISLLDGLPQIIVRAVLQPLVLNLSFRGTVTIFLFGVVGFDLYLNHEITYSAVILSVVALVALYLEQMLTTADELKLIKIFEYKAKK